jgi:protein-S-isoprenylcysteine O-methyltransferase Ste14
MSTANHSEQEPQGVNRRRVALTLLSMAVFFALFVLLPDWTWGWTKGRLFSLVFLGASAVSVSYLWRANPQVVIARSRSHTGTERWDIILLYFFIPSIIAIVPVAALDDDQFHWFPLPWWVCGVGYVMFLVGFGIVTWAEAVNKFFEPTVRLQTDRGHTVVDTGPYAIVRHPGYVGFFLMAMGAALSLGSLWALIPVGLASLMLILRAQWEDQTLQAELQGYKEYTQRVRHKLIPGVW